LKATIGTHALALAAKHHNIPVIVCTALFKLSPEYFNDSNNVSIFEKLNKKLISIHCLAS
jgi:translation initiation factor eIF-2B subunit beta